jgi:predicted metal-dependent TIM-barrel fold hydrolase
MRQQPPPLTSPNTLELAKLLVQIRRGRADDEAVDALGEVGLKTTALDEKRN